MTSEYRDFALDLASRAGAIMTTNFRLGMDKTWKSDGTPVTVTDLMVNDMLLKSVAESFPDHGVVAEEASSGSAAGKEWVWVCDPIDGTVPFSHGVPTFTFSLGLLRNGQPVLGVVLDPIGDRQIVAEKGKGAFLNDASLRVSAIEALDTIAVDFEDQRPDALANGSFRTRLKKRGVLVHTMWSCVYSSMLVATGEFAAMISNGGYVWDAAAMATIIPEAGGMVTDLSGAPLDLRKERLNGFIVSNSDVHAALLEEVNA